MLDTIDNYLVKSAWLNPGKLFLIRSVTCFSFIPRVKEISLTLPSLFRRSHSFPRGVEDLFCLSQTNKHIISLPRGGLSILSESLELAIAQATVKLVQCRSHAAAPMSVLPSCHLTSMKFKINL